MPPQHCSLGIHSPSPPIQPPEVTHPPPPPSHHPFHHPPHHRRTWRHQSAPELPLHFQIPTNAVEHKTIPKWLPPRHSTKRSGVATKRFKVTRAHLCTTFAAKFVLEVLGGAGAIWGSSEVLALRTPENEAAVFRPLAAAVGTLFFFRWCWQLYSTLQKRRQPRNRGKKDATGTNEIESLVLVENHVAKDSPEVLVLAPSASLDESIGESKTQENLEMMATQS